MSPFGLAASAFTCANISPVAFCTTATRVPVAFSKPTAIPWHHAVLGAVASATADEVRSALTHLEARGEIARRRAAGGAEVYARTPTTKRAEADTFLLGVDLGGTKTEIIALDAGGNERLRRRENTP